MPTYEYRCTDCGEHVEAVQSFSDDPLTTCKACGGKLKKVFTPVGIVFKGSGFYKTDSRTSSKSKSNDSSSAKESSGSNKDSSGSNKDSSGSNKDSSGSNRDSSGSNKDSSGSKSPSKDSTSKGSKDAKIA